MALMEAYARLDQFEKAHGVWEKAIAQQLDAPQFHRILLEIAFMQNDEARSAQELHWFEGRDDEYSASSPRRRRPSCSDNVTRHRTCSSGPLIS